jgi:Mrp family chromosome partitioning ATPase
MKGLIASLRDEAEHIVIDTAPVGVVTDAALLAADADATVFVVRESFSSEPVVRRGRDALAAVNAHLVGVVLNFVRPRAGEAEPYFATYVDEKPAPEAAARVANAPGVGTSRSFAPASAPNAPADAAPGAPAARVVPRHRRPRSTSHGQSR